MLFRAKNSLKSDAYPDIQIGWFGPTAEKFIDEPLFFGHTPPIEDV